MEIQYSDPWRARDEGKELPNSGYFQLVEFVPSSRQPHSCHCDEKGKWQTSLPPSSVAV